MIELLKDDYDFYGSRGCGHGSSTKRIQQSERELLLYAEKLGIDVKDTYAFGDSANDVDMLEFAGVGVAMGDGTDVAKEHADYVTKGGA